MKKQESLEPAAQALLKLDIIATNCKSSRSRRGDAKNVSITKKNPVRNLIARFILNKYVLPEKIVYARDITVAYKLADRHPDLEFWKHMPIKHQLDSLVMLWSQESRTRLTREWQNYERKLLLQRSIVLDSPSNKYTIGEKTGADFQQKPKKIQSVIEFCR